MIANSIVKVLNRVERAQTVILKRYGSIGLIAVTMLSFFGCKLNTTNHGKNTDYGDQIAALLSKMTLAEKIGQMTQVNEGFLQTKEDIKTYYLGSLLSGGGFAPETNNPTAWADMVDDFQSYALQTRLQIPLIYGIDAVHGHNNVYGATIFPHNVGMGCTHNPDLVQQAAEITAQEMAATGIQWAFSPCVAVPQDERWGRYYEGFSESPDIVKTMAAASVHGYQGQSLSDPETAMACAKHYIGDGGTVWGTGLNGKIDRGDTELSEAEIRAIHLPGYISALEAGVGSIMVSYSSINGAKMHGSKYYITDVLKNELGFQGLVVSDWAGINGLGNNYKEDIEIAINAGIDMVMVPEHYVDFINKLTELVNEGRVSMDRINDAVTRILRAKFRLGVFDHPYAYRQLLPDVGNDQHRNVARECVRESMVLLKNKNHILPIDKSRTKILVTGSAANDIGNQCGGWTISWQGSSGNITIGTTIYEAITNIVDDPSNVVLSEDGMEAQNADVAIAIIGEKPYAEMQGDRSDLSLRAEDITVLNNLKSSGRPTIVVLVSGRPLIISDYLNDWDGFIAAWLPGTEGQGVADVLFGDYNPTGKLSMTWPRSLDQIPINRYDANPLFEFGYGLNY